MHEYATDGYCREGWKWYTRTLVGAIAFAVAASVVYGLWYLFMNYWPYPFWGVIGIFCLLLFYVLGRMVEDNI